MKHLTRAETRALVRTCRARGVRISEKQRCYLAMAQNGKLTYTEGPTRYRALLLDILNRLDPKWRTGATIKD